jgi:hypothetical protein
MALAQRMHASGESANTIAATLGVSRATVYQVLADNDGEELSDAPLRDGRVVTGSARRPAADLTAAGPFIGPGGVP